MTQGSVVVAGQEGGREVGRGAVVVAALRTVLAVATGAVGTIAAALGRSDFSHKAAKPQRHGADRRRSPFAA